MRILVASTALILALAGSTALAADTTAKGKVNSMDQAKCTVTLEDGKTYQFPKGCDFSKVKANENVQITYSNNGSTNDASKISSAG